MKRWMPVLLVVVLLSQLFSATAYAAPGVPVGGCLPGFQLHEFMDHSGDMHMHIGVTEDLHLHVDNTVPLQ